MTALVRDAVDTLLEVSVVGSFTNAGYRARRALYGWRDAVPGSMRGRTVAITGPTSGLGRAATDALADLGARVVLIGRNAERLAAVRDDLVRRHGEDRFPIVVADMASLASVRGAVAQILATEPRLDVLIDNAGAIYPTRREIAGWHRGDAGRARRRALRADLRAPAAAAGGRRRPGDQRHVGWHVHAGRRPVGPAVAPRGVFGRACLREGQTDPDRPSSASGRRRLDGSGVIVNAMHPGLGRHAGPGRIAALVLSGHAAAPADAGAGGRHDRVARVIAGCAAFPGGCSWIGGRGRSTASRRPDFRPQSGESSGRGGWAGRG